LFMGVDWINGSPTAVLFNDTARDCFYLRDVPPQAQIPFTMTVRGYGSGPLEAEIGVHASTTDEFTDEVYEMIEDMRLRFLSGGLQGLPAEFVATVTDPDAWRPCCVQDTKRRELWIK